MPTPAIAAFLFALLFGSACGSSKAPNAGTTQRVEAHTPTPSSTASTHDPMALKFSGYTVAHVRSGNYGGSTQFEVFPSEYSYSHCDAKTLQAADRAEFDRLVTAYLNSIKVNGSISLGEYLELLYKQDSTALQAVHARYDVRRPVGNASQPQATLFFVDDAQGTVLRLDPYRTEITWDETTTALGNFMRDHAKHFSSTMQDEFFQKHYGRDH